MRRKEVWKDISGYEGFYQISSHGRIKSMARTCCKGQRRPQRIKRLSNDKDGYLITSLSKDRVNQMIRVHRIVGIHFVDNPDNKPFINHKKGNKKDNRYWMLEWVTNLENIIHARKTGLHSEFGENHKDAKLTNKQALEIFKSKEVGTLIAKRMGVNPLIVSRVRTGYTYFNITGKEYVKSKQR